MILIHKAKVMVEREVVHEESKEIKVPYAVLDSTDISKVAFAINVQLTLNDARKQGSTKNSFHSFSQMILKISKVVIICSFTVLAVVVNQELL
jgi:hypothetical protein